MTFSLYLGFKWLSWRQAIRSLSPSRPPIARSLAYLFLWPGMNGARFLSGKPFERRPLAQEWLRAVRNVIVGAALVWYVSAQLLPSRPLAAARAGMAGIVLALHLGALQLLSLAWRRAGVDAPPIMQRPTAASSLADFWGRRWNTAFRDLAYQLIYRPLARHWGARRAMAAVFLFSGLLHDLVISLPARAGYGLPTLYFLMQAIGVEIERSKLGRRWQLRGGVRGWLFAAAMIVTPAALLFHHAFLRHVVIPFLNTLGA